MAVAGGGGGGAACLRSAAAGGGGPAPRAPPLGSSLYPRRQVVTQQVGQASPVQLLDAAYRGCRGGGEGALRQGAEKGRGRAPCPRPPPRILTCEPRPLQLAHSCGGAREGAIVVCAVWAGEALGSRGAAAALALRGPSAAHRCSAAPHSRPAGAAAPAAQPASQAPALLLPSDVPQRHQWRAGASLARLTFRLGGPQCRAGSHLGERRTGGGAPIAAWRIPLRCNGISFRTLETVIDRKWRKYRARKQGGPGAPGVLFSAP